jgi:HlyD family secretion protein
MAPASADRRHLLGRAAAAAVALPLLAAAASGCGGHGPGVATVSKGDVTTTIDAVGSLQHLTQENLNFSATGKLVSLKVKVGDPVMPGQEVAKTDNTEQRMLLRKAQNELIRQQALLDSFVNTPEPEGLKTELDHTEDIVGDQRDTRGEVEDAGESSIGQASRELSFDKKDLATKQAVLAACLTQPLCFSNPITLRDRQNDVQDARRRVLNSQGNLREARHRLDVEKARVKTEIDQGELGETVSENKNRLNEYDLKYKLIAQRAALDSAQADLIRAQKALDATILRSNFKGSVFQINGNVGDVITNVAAVAPLGTAATPARPDAAAPVVDGGPAPAAPPSTEPFIVIKDVNAYQVSAPYSAVDAARMKVGQAANVSFDTVSGLTRKAVVSSITPADPTVKDTTYVVKLTLTETDPRLTEGVATQVRLIASTTVNVLVVPTSAVHRNGMSGTVTIVAPDGGRRDVPVELGAIGTDNTQVVSGVREGDQVALPDK